MRRNFILFVVVPVLVLGVVLYLFLDGWVEAGLEYAGEKSVGARVEIDNLHLTLSPIGMRFDRLQVTDPKDTWSNMFETGRVQFAVDAGQLLRAKFIVDVIEVDRLILGTKRATDGKLPAPPLRPAAKPDTSSAIVEFAVQASPVLTKDEKGAASFDIDKIRKELKVDSLINPKNLLTYRLLDSLQQQVDVASRRWDSTLADIDRVKRRADEIESTVRSLNVSEIKTLPAAQSAFTTAKTAYDGSRDIITTLDERKRTLTESVNMLSAGVRSVDDVAKQDLANTLALAKLPGVDMKGLGALVLGKDIMQKAEQYLGYVDLARAKIPQYTPKPDPNQPKRSEGVTIHFPEERSFPKFWVRKIAVSAGTDASRDPNYFYASGLITDISNDQRLTGKPLAVALSATRGGTTSLTFDAFFDRRGETPHDRYAVNVTGIPVGALETGRADFLPSRIENALARARIAVDVPGNKLESSARIDLAGIQMRYGRDARSVVERIVRDVMDGVKGFFVDLRIWRNDVGSLDVAFATDLDDQLSSRTRKVIGDEVAKIQNEIRAKLNAQIAAKRKQVEGLVAKKRAEVEARLRDLEQQVRSKVSVVEQKKVELEQRVEQEKKKAEEGVKKKAGEVLKGILKK